jgi:hypothetical protein
MLPIPTSLQAYGIPDIPDCHREMYAEWVKRGRPQMELQVKDGSWVQCGTDPGWNSDIKYRFKDEQSFEEGIAEIRESMKAPRHLLDERSKAMRHLLDERSKAMRHLLDEMPSAKEFKASSEDHDAGLPTSALQTQVGGDHYAKMKIQPAEYCHANGIGHMAGDAISYISRYKDKNGKQDLLKAIHSLQLLIELEYGDEG